MPCMPYLGINTMGIITVDTQGNQRVATSKSTTVKLRVVLDQPIQIMTTAANTASSNAMPKNANSSKTNLQSLSAAKQNLSAAKQV